MNCGPKQAFTVVGEDGEPLLVHNCFTFNSKQHPEAPQRLFILRDYQEDLASLLIKSIGVHDVVVPKSRDMGGSWVPLALLLWLWQHYDYQTALLGSRKQDYVDKAGNPDALFWRLEYMWKMMPRWMRPPMREKIDRKLNTFANPTNGSVITGEATNKDFGRGGRPGIIMLDEFAAVECGFEVLSATGEATSTRWMISTFYGAFGAFYDQYEKKLKNNPECIFSMHWSKHPDKRKGLYTSKPVGKEYVLQILDTDYPWERDADGNITYKFILDGKLRSIYRDWYEREKSGSAQETAQQLDMEAQAAGWQFMSSVLCDSLAMKFSRPHLYRGDFEFTDPLGEVKWREDHRGAVQIWCALTTKMEYDGKHDAVAGCDLAMGISNDGGSNSVASFYDSLTKEKIAQITTMTMPPHKFARYVAAAARFFSGPNGPAIINYEDNGPGQYFGNELIKELQIRNVWMRRDTKKIDAKTTGIPGWHSGDDTKKALLNAYKAALLEDRIFNRCREAIMECAEYVMQPNETVEHSKALQTTDLNAKGELHGDMVIADAIAYLAMQEAPSVAAEEAEPEIPENSFEGRRRRAAQSRRSNGGSW